MKNLVKYLTLSLLFFSIPTLSNALPECEGTFHNCAGIKTWENGDEYYGDFKNNKRHGYGTYYYKSGNEYDGGWKNNKKHGIGNFYWKDGDKYVGDWLNNKRTGKGKFTFADGDKYVGDFLDNKRHGKGTYTYKNGDKYVGDFLDNKRHGKGTYTYKNGDKYVGDWVNGKRTGKGIFTFADGTKQEGVFRDSKFLFSEKIDKNQNINDSNNPISLALKQKPVEIKKTTKKVSKDNNSISSALNKKPVKINKPSNKINKESNNSISRGLSKKPVEFKKPIKENKPIKKINKKIVNNKSTNDKSLKILHLKEYNSTQSVGWDKVNPAIKFLVEHPPIELKIFPILYGPKFKDLVVEKTSRCFIKYRHNLPVSDHGKYGKVEKVAIDYNRINWNTESSYLEGSVWKFNFRCDGICFSYYGNRRRHSFEDFEDPEQISWYGRNIVRYQILDNSYLRFKKAIRDLRKSCKASTSKY